MARRICCFIIILILGTPGVFACEARAETRYQGANGDPGQIVRLGVLANRGNEICLSEWTPTAEYLSAQLAPWRFEIVPLKYSEARNAVEKHLIEFLLVNPSMYVAMEYEGLVSRIATFQQPSVKGTNPLPIFGGVIFCRADRQDIQSLRDIVGKRFCAVEPFSFGGWQAAWREFDRIGVHPHKDFAQLRFAGTQDAVVRAVRSGEADAGTVRSTQLERMALEGLIDLGEFRVLNAYEALVLYYPFLLSTELYPEWPFAAVKGTDLELGKAVTSALLRMSRDDPAAVASRGAGWAIPQDYTSLHECLKDLRLPPYENYGTVTIGQAAVQHWGYILVITVAIAVALIFSCLTWRTGARLKASLMTLKESEQKFRSVVEHIEDIFCRIDARERIAIISPSAARLLGYDSTDDLIGQSPDIFWADPSQRLATLDELSRSGHVRDWEFTAIRRDGSLLTAAATLHVILDEQGNPQGYEGIWRNITERKKAEEALRNSESRMRAIADSAQDAILMMSPEGLITYWNPAAECILGYTGEEAIGRDLHKLLAPQRYHAAHYAAFSGFLETGRGAAVNKVIEFVALRKDGAEIPVELSLSAVFMNGWHAVGLLRDITRRKTTEEKIRHMATHDALTGLPSLRLAKDRLSMALGMARRHKKLAVVMFADLDGFKAVNDTLGHDGGNYVLKQVAQRLLSGVRETDTVARLGGDEFLLIAAGLSAPEDAAQIAEKVIRLVSEPIICNGRRAVVGASIGIALYPDDGEDMDQLIKQADKAMYRIKNSGKNGFGFANTRGPGTGGLKASSRES